MSTVLTRLPGIETAGARVMAEAWAGYHVALWYGDPAVSAFAEWLAGYWESALDRPAGEPDAQSPLGVAGGPASIDWYERAGWVSGHLPGQQGGYLLPRATVLEYPWVTLEEPAA